MSPEVSPVADDPPDSPYMDSPASRFDASEFVEVDITSDVEAAAAITQQPRGEIFRAKGDESVAAATAREAPTVPAGGEGATCYCLCF